MSDHLAEHPARRRLIPDSTGAEQGRWRGPLHSGNYGTLRNKKSDQPGPYKTKPRHWGSNVGGAGLSGVQVESWITEGALILRVGCWGPLYSIAIIRNPKESCC